MVLPCQDSLSFLSLDNREGFGEQTLPGKGWGLPTGGNLRQAGARRAQRQRHSSLQSPPVHPAKHQHGTGGGMQGRKCSGPVGPSCRMLPTARLQGLPASWWPPSWGSWRGPGARGANRRRSAAPPPPRSPPPPAAHRHGPPKLQPMGINLRARRSRD